ncbi:cobalamin B12-binding domain-containing protein [Loktanella fryxellensis]|nr:cobalamin B12-binding domain-containing protein [Loktanella fryxellensis]
MMHIDLWHLKKSALQERLNSVGPDNIEALITNSLGSVPNRFSADLLVELENTARNVWQLTRALIAEDPADGVKYVQNLEFLGTTRKEILSVYLKGAARLLGEWLDQSRISLVDVNIATLRIQAINRTIEATSRPSLHSFGKVALFASVPGETHLKGLKIAAEIFRRAGWNIDLCLGFTKDDLITRILERDHCIIALSCSGSHLIASLRQLVEDIRSKAPRVKVILSEQVLIRYQSEVANLAIGGNACSVPEAFGFTTRLVDTPYTAKARSGNVIYGAIKHRAFEP